MNRLLIVGAGFSGAVMARVFAEHGFLVDLIDKRNHLCGNAFDKVDSYGERVHVYGPHLLHGNPKSPAVAFLSRFTEWVDYEHRVRALLPNGATTPLPVNRTTLEDVFGISLLSEHDAVDFLESLRISSGPIHNADEAFVSTVGETLSNLFFRPYTRKMWGLSPTRLPVSLARRLPLRVNRDDRYFSDLFQALPLDGYARLFERLLDHPLIEVKLGSHFSHSMIDGHLHAFLCMPIDQYFGFCFGALPYRSIIFHHQRAFIPPQQAPVINFTDSGPFTRSTQWSLLPNSGTASNGSILRTIEEPCSIDRNPGEYYYPVHTPESKRLYQRYLHLARQLSNITFCGRTGLFRYIDMIPAVEIHLRIARQFLKRAGRLSD